MSAMRWTIRALSALAAGLLVVTVSGAAAVGSTPIRPHQHFVGIVNGKRASSTTPPVVITVCAGPIWPGRTGPVASNQTLAVAQVASGGGYTGLFSQVYAWFVQDNSAGGPQQVRFTSYGTSMAIPSSVRVPCGGTGQVEFSSCPHLAPCAAGWVPIEVTVRFEDIAV